MSEALVRCDCGWAIPESVYAAPASFTLAPYVSEMIRHWQDGHVLQCRAELRYQVRDLLKRYRQVQREARRTGVDGDVLAQADREHRAAGRRWVMPNFGSPFEDD